MAIWFLAGIARSDTVKLSTAVMRDMGVDRHAVYRGLKELEKSGLVAVMRHPGRNAIVKLLEVPHEPEQKRPNQ